MSASRFRHLVFLPVLLLPEVASAGTWTKLHQTAPGPVNLMLLLSDGTVMAARNDGGTIGKSWYRLNPDIHGSYVNGYWSAFADAHDTRLYYPSQVLKDGRVFVAGAEYGSGGPHAEVFDPKTNVWTQVDPPPAIWNTATDLFFDCNSELLSDGRVLLMPVVPHSYGVGLIYDPVNNTWQNAAQLAYGGYQDEASWVKLPDNSILTIDPFGTHSERFISLFNLWINDATVPVSLYDPYVGELGGALLLPSGKAFFLGSTGHTALYTPSLGFQQGVWTAGPDIPNGNGTPDAPAAMLVTGNVLCATSPTPSPGNGFPAPTTFYEYDPVANSFSLQPAPNGTTDNTPTFTTLMLDLPDGTVLYSHMGKDLYVYKPTGSPLAAGKPTITSITPNANGSYHLVGTQLNGISEGASYGDDFQMNSNYPLVRLTSGTSVYYARTFNWSSTGVMTGSLPVSTEFTLPASLPPGVFSLEVVANGIASNPVSFSAYVCQLDLGFGGPGNSKLSVCGGDLSTGTTAALSVTGAAANQAGILLASTQVSPIPFLGGTLVTVPVLIQVSLFTNAAGQVQIPAIPGGGGPLALDLQYVYVDPSLLHGVGISNAVRVDFKP